MNFGERVKKEIINKPVKESHCKKAFLAGVLRGAGVLYSNDGEIGLLVKLADEETAMTVGVLLDFLYGYEIREITVAEDRLNKKDRFTIYIGGDRAIDILEDLEIFSETEEGLKVNFDFFGKLTEKPCCLHSFFRGLFVSAGSCTVPSDNGAKTGYHLELSLSRAETASAVSNKLADNGISAKIMRRKEFFVVYIKSVEGIEDFLAFLPAPVSVLKLTDIAIKKELLNDSNRRKNCDLGNVGRQIEAVEKQIAAIEIIEREKGIDFLKSELKEVALARKDNPDETLSELAQRLNLGKSCLNHRFRKIISIAKEIETDHG